MYTCYCSPVTRVWFIARFWNFSVYCSVLIIGDSQSVVNNIIIIIEFLPPKASSYELITFKSDRTRFNASFIKFFKYNPSDYLMWYSIESYKSGSKLTQLLEEKFNLKYPNKCDRNTIISDEWFIQLIMFIPSRTKRGCITSGVFHIFERSSKSCHFSKSLKRNELQFDINKRCY